MERDRGGGRQYIKTNVRREERNSRSKGGKGKSK